MAWALHIDTGEQGHASNTVRRELAHGGHVPDTRRPLGISTSTWRAMVGARWEPILG
jgi:hypothetical protein